MSPCYSLALRRTDRICDPEHAAPGRRRAQPFGSPARTVAYLSDGHPVARRGHLGDDARRRAQLVDDAARAHSLERCRRRISAEYADELAAHLEGIGVVE